MCPEGSRLDVVTDSYFDKVRTKENRGVSQYYPFTSTTLIPKDFKESFLSNSKNKQSLNEFIARKLIVHDFGNVTLLISLNSDILQNVNVLDRTIDDLAVTRSQEEADTKIIVHILSHIRNDHTKILVRTGDTDVVTLILAHLSLLQQSYGIEVDFGFGKNRKYYNINTISLHLSDEQRSPQLFFYIFTRSDVTSSFFNLLKKLWWKVWSENAFMSQTFIKLSWTPNDITEMDYLKIEKLVCTAYDPQKRFLTDDVNRLRYLLISMSTDNNLRKLPPSRAALKQHILRSAYAAGWIWGGCLNNCISIPPPMEWGWKSDDEIRLFQIGVL